MKYLIRALKYLVYFIVLFFVLVFIIWLISPKGDGGFSLSAMFQPGSLPKIGIFFLLIAAAYPYFGFTKRKVYTGGTFEEHRDEIVNTFLQWGYELESEADGKLSFRMKGKVARLTRMYEDRIVVDTTSDPLILAGYRRDVDRMARNLSSRLARTDSE